MFGFKKVENLNKEIEKIKLENKKLENNVIELIKEGNKNGETY